jgi:hypothetical protein
LENINGGIDHGKNHLGTRQEWWFRRAEEWQGCSWGYDSKRYMNAITSLGLPTAKIPVYFETEREMLEKAVASLATGTPERLRIVRIVNTLEMDRLLVLEALGEEVRGQGYLSVAGEARKMAFDKAGIFFRSFGRRARIRTDCLRVRWGNFDIYF